MEHFRQPLKSVVLQKCCGFQQRHLRMRRCGGRTNIIFDIVPILPVEFTKVRMRPRMSATAGLEAASAGSANGRLGPNAPNGAVPAWVETGRRRAFSLTVTIHADLQPPLLSS